MEPTQVKRGSGSELPAPVEREQPEAYERAPTLMAGATAGVQGKVRVWSPSKKALYGSMGVGVPCILIGLFLFLLHGRGAGHLIGFFDVLGGVLAMTPGITGLRRPRYISTDDAGIALAGADGNRAFRWDEINSFTSDDRYLVFALPSGKVWFELAGYSRGTRQELLDVIGRRTTRRSQLPGPQTALPQ